MSIAEFSEPEYNPNPAEYRDSSERLPDDEELLKAVIAAAENEAHEIEVTTLSAIEAAEAELIAEQRKIEEELQAKLREIRTQKSRLENDAYAARRARNKLTKQINEAKAKLITMERARFAEQMYADVETRYNAIAATAFWREHAKDHQMVGAIRMAANGKYLLADTMGTGKTATCTFALDLLKGESMESGYRIHWDEYSGYHNCALIAAGISSTYVSADDTLESLPKKTMSFGENFQDFVTQGKVLSYSAEYGSCDCVPPQSDIYAGSSNYGKYRFAFHLPPVGKRILWMGPASVMRQTQREIQRWSPQRIVINMAGENKQSRRALLDTLQIFRDTGSDYIVLLNYEFGDRDKDFVRRLAEPGVFDTIVLDEAHNIKNVAKIRYKNVRFIIENSAIRCVFPMTGTPILNKPQELFALLSLIDPKNFYNLNQFLNSYCQQQRFTSSNGNVTWRWVFKDGGAERLLKKMGHLYIRRTKREAGFELPEPDVRLYELELDPDLYPKQYAIYNEMRRTAMVMLDPEQGKAITAMIEIAVKTRLRQIINWPDGITLMDSEGNPTNPVECGESVKIDACIKIESINKDGEAELEGLIPEVLNEDKVVIFSQLNSGIKEGNKRCLDAGITSAYITGELNEAQRDEVIRKFTTTELGDPNGIDVLWLNYKVGGVGIDGLQKVCSNAIVLDEEWNPGKRDQAYDRLNRFGQKNAVTIHLLRVKNSIDTWMADIIAQKEQMIEGFNAEAANLSEQMWEALKNGLI